jgi:hypothetical protein
MPGNGIRTVTLKNGQVRYRIIVSLGPRLDGRPGEVQKCFTFRTYAEAEEARAEIVAARGTRDPRDRYALAKELSLTRPTTELLDPFTFHVYLLWGDDLESPLYVGSSTNVIKRLSVHLSDPVKKCHIRHIQLIACESKDEMLRKENGLILSYRPPWNRVAILASREVDWISRPPAVEQPS